MKIHNKQIKRIAEGIMKTNVASSSLEEKTAEYFRNNPSDISILELRDNADYIQSLLKKGDELAHTIYIYCHKDDKQSKYITQYPSYSFEKLEEVALKSIKTQFKRDGDNSGIFNYKVFRVSQEIFTDADSSTEAESPSVKLIGDEYYE